MIIKVIIYSILGYSLGSILFAKVFGKFFANCDITKNTSDNNPGVYNAFKNGGMLTGILTLIFDLLKGILPVFLFFVNTKDLRWYYLFVVVSPVLGHIFPLFFKFKGGKGIATTFGVLIGLACVNIFPLLSLVIYFIFFSCVVKISPNFHRTIITYIVSIVTLILFKVDTFAIFALLFPTLLVSLRMLLANEEKENFKVGFLWMH